MELVIKFQINTSIKHFEQWLDRYRLGTLPMLLVLEENKSLSVTSAPTFIGEYQGLRRHEIRARISTPDPQKDDTAILSFPFPVIEFEIEEPSENRLMINVWCKHTELTPYYSDMFDEIAKRWPEAETAIRNQLTDEVKEQSEQAGDKIKNEYSADREQSEELIESIIKLPFADAKDELEKFIWQCELQGRLSLPRDIIDLPEGYGYDINHIEFGKLGQLSIHPREGKQTRIRITKPCVPTQDEAITAAGKAGFDVLHINAEDWLFENREVENSKFRKSVFEYMARAASLDTMREDLSGKGVVTEKADEPESENVEEIPEYGFYKLGDYWNIIYQGERAHLRDLKGLRQIHRLLQNTYKDISAIELMSVDNPPPSEDQSIDYDDIPMKSQFDEEPIWDGKTLTEVRERLEELKERKREIIEMQGDTSEVESEINKINELAKSTIGRYGKSRVFDHAGERARTNVTKTIRYATVRIKEVGMSKCAKHLDANISRGKMCSYSPQEQLEWKLD
jgi:hypothetical protein